MPSQAAAAFWPHSADERIASFRIRCAQVCRGLDRLGMPSRLYAPGDLAPAVLVLSKRYDEASVAHANALRAGAGTRWVLDLCDNHFFHKEATDEYRARAARLVAACEAADHVVVASHRLGHEVRSHCPGVRGITVIGDAVDELTTVGGALTLREQWHRLCHRLFFATHRAAPGRRLVWFGTHGFRYADGGMMDLQTLSDALHRHHARAPLTLTVISNSRRKFRELRRGWRFPCVYLPWSNRLFARVMGLHDVALVPVLPNPVTACKTDNRLVTAFSFGAAVAAGSIPSYEPFRDCAVLDDWDDGLAALMNDAPIRVRRVALARALIRERNAPEVICRQWASVMASLAPSLTSSLAPARMASVDGETPVAITGREAP